jgi:hypothetical protein
MARQRRLNFMLNSDLFDQVVARDQSVLAALTARRSEARPTRSLL